MYHFFTKSINHQIAKKSAKLAVFLLSALIFCSCGKNISEDNPAGNEETPSSQQETDTAAKSDTAAGSDQSTDLSDSGATVFPKTIVDNEQLSFIVRSSSMDPVSGLTWNVYLENKTEQNLLFCLEKVSINDVMCDPYWAEVVSSGRNSTSQITWMPDALNRLEIDSATKIQFGLLVYDDDDYTAAPVERTTYTVYPLGEENATQTLHSQKESDSILLDNDVCTITYTSWDPESDWGAAMHLYITNKTNQDLMFSVQNVSLNDTMCDPYWASVISAGCSSDEAIIWNTSSTEEKGIAEISTVTLPFTAYSEDDIMNTLVDETFTIDVRTDS